MDFHERFIQVIIFIFAVASVHSLSLSCSLLVCGEWGRGSGFMIVFFVSVSFVNHIAVEERVDCFTLTSCPTKGCDCLI